MPKAEDGRFWEALDALVSKCPPRIDRPKGSRHPRYPELIYPLDYGYLQGSTTVDGGGVDVWRGELAKAEIVGVVMTVDLLKRDAEIKVLIGTSETDIRAIMQFHASMAPLLVRKAAFSVSRPE
jgi:inorganic pyrophosphatase